MFLIKRSDVPTYISQYEPLVLVWDKNIRRQLVLLYATMKNIRRQLVLLYATMVMPKVRLLTHA